MLTEPRWLNDAVVLLIHAEQIAEHGGADGLRDQGLLASALARPRHLRAYEPDSSLARLAAAYGFGVINNHPFLDGNKRTGAVICETFLRLNGLLLDAEDAAWCETILKVAAGDLSEDQFATWIEERVTDASS